MSPRGRKKRKTLTRERVIDAATKLLQAEGVEAVTLRRLADDFGVTPMALYRHVRDKDDILSSVLSKLLERALFPGDTESWERYLRSYSNGLRSLLLEHRSLVRAILNPKALEVAALDAMEGALTILRSAGFPRREAARLFTSINSFTIGSALWQAMRSEHVPVKASSPSKMPYWKMDFEDLDRDRFRELRLHARSLRARSFDHEFRDGIDRILKEAASQLERTE